MKRLRLHPPCDFMFGARKVAFLTVVNGFGQLSNRMDCGEGMMFATKAAFGNAIPKGLGEPGYSYWLAVELTMFSAWYLLTYRVATADGGTLMQTIAVAWESTLASALDSGGPRTVVGLCAIRPPELGTGRWTMREVQTVWTPAQGELEQGPLLFSYVGDSRVYGSQFDVVHEHCDGRRVVMSLP